MKINPNEVFKTLGGGKMQIADTATSPPEDMTLRKIAIEALLAEERDTPATKKVERFTLAQRFYDAKDEVELTPEEATEVRACIGRVYPPLIVGQAFKMLN